jgi:iron complex transport system substrate-binding protein
MTRCLRFAALLALLLLCAACRGSGPAATSGPTVTSPREGLAATPPAEAAAPASVVDVAGRTVTVKQIPRRIISLAPSNTEILFALELGSLVVAVDDFSDFPASAQQLPRIGGANQTYHFEQILALSPDLILAAEVTPPEVIRRLEDLQLTVAVISTTETSFESIFHDISLVGQLTGRQDRAGALVASMRERRDAIVAGVREDGGTTRVYWELDATDLAKPYTVGPGNFVNDLIALAGGVNVFATASSPYLQVGLEQVVAAQPDVIILADTEYGITVESVGTRPGWQGLPAVEQRRVYAIESALVSRPGPRIIAGLEATARLLHPEAFQ